MQSGVSTPQGTEHPGALRREALGFQGNFDGFTVKADEMQNRRRSFLRGESYEEGGKRFTVEMRHPCERGKMEGGCGAPRYGLRRLSVDKRGTTFRGNWKGPDWTES